MSDASRRFLIGRGEVRGEYVHMRSPWQAMLKRRSYPHPVVSLLGECLAAATLFTSTVKMLQDDGRLLVQIQGGKPVSLIVAECCADLSVRAMARVEGGAQLGEGPAFSELARGASFALTIDPGGDYDSYQSLVPVEGGSLARALDAYMTRSEQIETHFSLAADSSVCAGLLVQRVPQQGGKADADSDPDLWNRIRTLAATASRTDLLELDPPELLHRLFHQEDVRLLPERPVRFVCRCSRERVVGVLKMVGPDEVRGLLADRRTIDVDCDFCGLRYTLSAEEAWAALAS